MAIHIRPSLRSTFGWGEIVSLVTNPCKLFKSFFDQGNHVLFLDFIVPTNLLVWKGSHEALEAKSTILRVFAYVTSKGLAKYPFQILNISFTTADETSVSIQVVFANLGPATKYTKGFLNIMNANLRSPADHAMCFLLIMNAKLRSIT